MRNPSYAWRYTPLGHLAHALSNPRETTALCGVGVQRADDWRGTGDQGEYERVAALPTCPRCAAKAGGTE